MDCWIPLRICVIGILVTVYVQESRGQASMYEKNEWKNTNFVEKQQIGYHTYFYIAYRLLQCERCYPSSRAVMDNGYSRKRTVKKVHLRQTRSMELCPRSSVSVFVCDLRTAYGTGTQPTTFTQPGIFQIGTVGLHRQ